MLLALPAADGEAKKPKFEGDGGNINVPGERPFDAVNIFGDLRKIFTLPNTLENKVWWERMVRGEVGKDRFLILCALKDGNWKSLRDIRDFIEFKMRDNYPVDDLQAMLLLMADRQRVWKRNVTWKLSAGEGWLERNRQANFSGIESEWRIEPSVYPLLYFLLMSCPGDDRCE